MSRTAKILVSLLLAGVVVVGAAAMLLWRYIDGHKDGWMQAGQTALRDGAHAGETRDDAQCVDEAFLQLRKDDSLGGLHTRLWIKGCLGASRPADGTCADVPRVDEVVGSIRWMTAFCASRGFANNNGCNGLAQELQAHCTALAASRQ